MADDVQTPASESDRFRCGSFPGCIFRQFLQRPPRDSLALLDFASLLGFLSSLAWWRFYLERRPLARAGQQDDGNGEQPTHFFASPSVIVTVAGGSTLISGSPGCWLSALRTISSLRSDERVEPK